MKTWYYALCEKCGEGTRIFVTNPSCTAHYLSDKDAQIQAFMSRHYGCCLRLVNSEGIEADNMWQEYKSEGDLIVRKKTG